VRQTNTYQKPPEDFAQGAGAIEVALSVRKHQIFLNPGTTNFTPVFLLLCLVASENSNDKDRQLRQRFISMTDISVSDR